MNKLAHNFIILSCIELSRNSIQAIKSKIKKRINEKKYVNIMVNEEIEYYHTINYITYWGSPQLKYSN